jgi:hypothetical protein
MSFYHYVEYSYLFKLQKDKFLEKIGIKVNEFEKQMGMKR